MGKIELLYEKDPAFTALTQMLQTQTITSETEKKYRAVLSEFLLFTKRPFAKTRGRDVEAYRTNLLSVRNLRKTTARRNLAILHSVVENMVERKNLLPLNEDDFPVNPFTAYLLKDESDEVDPRNVAPIEGVRKILARNDKDMTLSLSVLLCLKLLLHVRELAVLKASDVFYAEYEDREVLVLHVGKGPTERDMIVPSDLRELLISVRDGARANEQNSEGWLFFNDRYKKSLTAGALQMRLFRAARAEGLAESVNFNAIRNLGIALCRAPEDVLAAHLSFADDRHRQRVEVLRKLGDKVCAAGESVGVSVTLNMKGKR